MDESLRLELTITPKDVEKAQEALLEKKAGRVGKGFWLAFIVVGLALSAIYAYLNRLARFQESL